MADVSALPPESPEPELMGIVDSAIGGVIETFSFIIAEQVSAAQDSESAAAELLGAAFENIEGRVDQQIDLIDEGSQIISGTLGSATDSQIGAIGTSITGVQLACERRGDAASLRDSLTPTEPTSAIPGSERPSTGGTVINCQICNFAHPLAAPCPTGAVGLIPTSAAELGTLQAELDEFISETLGETTPEAVLFRTWFDPVARSCYTIPANLDRRQDVDLLVGSGDSRETSRQAAGDFCEPAIITGPPDVEPEVEPEENGKVPAIPETTPFMPTTVSLVSGFSPCSPDAYAAPQKIAAVYAEVAKTILPKQTGDSFGIGSALNFALDPIGTLKGEAGGQFKQQISVLDSIFRNLTNSLGTILGCGAATGVSAPMEALIGLINTFTANAFGHLQLPITYQKNVLCPVTFPSAAEATRSYLANSIDTSIRDTWWKQNGFCVEPMKLVLDADRTKLNVNELMQLRLRKKASQSEWNDGLRKLGYLHATERDKIWQLAEFIPPFTDLTRFMVRDAFDARLVAQFNLDAEFTQKFQGKIVDWAESQGITREMMQAIWRSHWTIPSPGQLYQMIHRLDKLIPGVTRSQVIQWAKDAMAQQDIAPFWRDKLLAISFVPKGRRDIRRAFNVGAIDRKEVLSSFEELGSNDKDAAILTDFVVRLRNESIRNGVEALLWRNEAITRKEAEEQLRDKKVPNDIIMKVLNQQEERLRNVLAVRLYRKDDLSRKLATDRLTEQGIRPVTIKRWLDDADRQKTTNLTIKGLKAGTIGPTVARRELTEAGWPADAIDRIIRVTTAERRIKLAHVCQKAIRRGFLTGDITAAEATGRLAASGTDPEVAVDLIKGWQCEQEAKGKVASTANIIKWFDDGIINAPEVLRRLDNIGWNRIDQGLILSSAIEKMNIRQAKQQKQAAQEAEREAEKERRKADKAVKDASSTAEKRKRQLEKAERTRQRIAKMLDKVQAKLADKLEIPTLDATAVIQQLHARNIGPLGLTQNESARSLVLALENTDFDNVAEFTVNSELQARSVLELGDL